MIILRRLLFYFACAIVDEVFVFIVILVLFYFPSPLLLTLFAIARQTAKQLNCHHRTATAFYCALNTHYRIASYHIVTDHGSWITTVEIDFG